MSQRATEGAEHARNELLSGLTVAHQLGVFQVDLQTVQGGEMRKWGDSTCKLHPRRRSQTRFSETDEGSDSPKTSKAGKPRVESEGERDAKNMV